MRCGGSASLPRLPQCGCKLASTIRTFVEGAMAHTGINVRVATHSGALHGGFESTHGFDRNEFVLIAEKDNCRRRFCIHMVRWRKIPVTVAHAFVSPLAGIIVKHRIEEHERIGTGRNRAVVLGVVEAGHERGRCGRMPACGTSRNDDAFRGRCRVRAHGCGRTAWKAVPTHSTFQTPTYTRNFGVCDRNVCGFLKRILSMISSLCPRRRSSSAVFGTASGSLTPQSHALFSHSRSWP